MRLAAVWLVTATALLCGAASASAATTWYANHSANGSTCTQIDQCKTISQAVARASDGDTIRIAVGTYTESIKTGKRLTFDGAGLGSGIFHNGSTALKGTTSGPPLELPGGGTVRDMVVVAADGPGGKDYQDALVFHPGTSSPYTVQNVFASSGAGTGGGNAGMALNLDGNVQHASLLVRDSTLVGHTTGTFANRVAGESTTATFDDVLIDAPGAVDALVSDHVLLTVHGGSLAGAGRSLEADGGTISAEGTTFGGAVGVSLDSVGPATLDVRDSLFRNTAEAIYVDGGVQPRTVNLTGDTLFARGGGAEALRVVDGNTTIHARNTIFHAETTNAQAATDILADQGSDPVTLDLSHSAYATVGGSASIPAPGSGTNFAGDPGFADSAGGNFTLAPGSPLIDFGDPAAVTSGETDLAGAARSLDGNGDCSATPDVGAYERAAADCPGGGGGGGGGTGDKKAPVISKVSFKPHRLKAGKRGRLRLRLSEKAKLTVLVQRRKGKHYKRVSRLTKSGGPGVLSLRLGKKLKRGRYRLELTAADAAGNRSRTARVGFVVVRGHR